MRLATGWHKFQAWLSPERQDLSAERLPKHDDRSDNGVQPADHSQVQLLGSLVRLHLLLVHRRFEVGPHKAQRQVQRLRVGCAAMQVKVDRLTDQLARPGPATDR